MGDNEFIFDELRRGDKGDFRVHANVSVSGISRIAIMQTGTLGNSPRLERTTVKLIKDRRCLSGTADRNNSYSQERLASPMLADQK